MNPEPTVSTRLTLGVACSVGLDGRAMTGAHLTALNVLCALPSVSPPRLPLTPWPPLIFSLLEYYRMEPYEEILF